MEKSHDGAFQLWDVTLLPEQLRHLVEDPVCGGYASFEGWVRNRNEGQTVLRLEYESYAPLALREGQRIVEHAREHFGVVHACCAHRVGNLAIGELAVWVGVSAEHRGEAFDACRFIIDEVKQRVPIWKKEHYVGGSAGWVNCEHCAAAPTRSADHSPHHGHEHA